MYERSGSAMQSILYFEIDTVLSTLHKKMGSLSSG